MEVSLERRTDEFWNWCGYGVKEQRSGRGLEQCVYVSLGNRKKCKGEGDKG
jgi:hypothetical protein